MNLQEQIKKDIEEVIFNEDEFATSAVLVGQEKPLSVLFKRESELVLASSRSDYEFEGGNAIVPMITVQNEDAKNICHDSILIIDSQEYEIIHDEKGEHITKYYLGYNQ